MKKNNKLLIMLLSGILLLSLIGCKTQDNTNDDDNENSVSKEEEIDNKAQSILDKMTLEEKIGQKFIVGFNGTKIPFELENSIKNYHFGNFIVLAANLGNPSDVAELVSDIQTTALTENGIPGFMSIDQEGGKVTRMVNGATHFPSNMAVSATNDSSNAYLCGNVTGQEIRTYGFNLDLAPVVDINNNPFNSIIGTRSYGDTSSIVTKYSTQMIKGLQDANVLSTVKHFPGHGNTNIDTHTGLPIVTLEKAEVEALELVPFQNAIDIGVDAIMTAHIIYTPYDEVYPATLSYNVITTLLREEMGFSGLVITDAMNMGAIVNNYTAAESAVLTTKAGSDIICEMSCTGDAVKAYEAVLNAVKSGDIAQSTIDESVLRIIKKKLQYNIDDEYLAASDYEKKITAIDETFNIDELYQKTLTIVQGTLPVLKKTDKILIISDLSTRFEMIPGVTGDKNSFAYACKYHLNNKSYEADYLTTATDSATLQKKMKDYDYVIVGIEDASSSEVTLVNALAEKSENLIVISLGNPYDINKYTGINNYICMYEYVPHVALTLAQYLNGEFTATGTLPVKLK